MSPEGWEYLKIGDVCKVKRGVTYKRSNLTTEGEGYPYITMKSFKKDGGYNASGLKFFDGKFSDDNLVKSNDLLITNTDLTPEGDILGLPAYLPIELYNRNTLYSHHVTALEFQNKITPSFAYYYLCSPFYRHEIKKITRGTTVKMLDKMAFKEISIAAPPLPEQRKIAAILGSVDAAIQATQKTIDQTRRVKQGLLNRLLTRGIGHTRFKQTEIGEIPEDWEYIKLRDITFDGEGLQTGPFGSQLHSSDYVDEGVAVIMPRDIIGEEANLEDAAHISQNKAHSLNKHKLEEGDILFARRGQLGRCGLIRQKEAGSLCGTGCLRARTDTSKVNSEYLIKFLQSKEIISWLNNNALGQTMLNLNTKILSNIPIALPPYREQIAIANAVNSLDRAINDNNKKLIQLQHIKKGLMADLLSGRVRVTPDEHHTDNVAAE